MAVTRRARSVLLLGAAMLAAVPMFVGVTAQAAAPLAVGIPLAPGVDFVLLSKGITTDPFELRSDGPTKLEFAQISIAPHGTTGLAASGGIVVATVNEGVATALSSDGGVCASRAVDTGSSIIRPAGSVGEIRNDSANQVELTVITLTPGDGVAALPAGACSAAAPKGVTANVLNQSVIDAPLTTDSKGTSDVFVGLVRFAPGSKIGWHVQQRPYLLGVDEGDLTLAIAYDARCDINTYPSDKGFFEPPQRNHDVRNETSQKASMYFIAFAANPQPLLAPAPPPRQCS